MKEYKYKINGTEYKVAVGDIENNVAQVYVNAGSETPETGGRSTHGKR